MLLFIPDYFSSHSCIGVISLKHPLYWPVPWLLTWRFDLRREFRSGK